MAGMQWTEYNLKNEIATRGIVSLELAGSLEMAQSIVQSWRDNHAMGYAGFNIGLDYLFLILYACVIGLVCALIANGFSNGHFFRKLGYFCSWIVVIAALFDAVENVAMIQLLTDSTEQIWITISYYFAIIKFTGVGIGIAYIVIGGIAHGIQRAIQGA